MLCTAASNCKLLLLLLLPLDAAGLLLLQCIKHCKHLISVPCRAHFRPKVPQHSFRVDQIGDAQSKGTVLGVPHKRSVGRAQFRASGESHQQCANSFYSDRWHCNSSILYTTWLIMLQVRATRYIMTCLYCALC
jgi:hypothetical protein